MSFMGRFLRGAGASGQAAPALSSKIQQLGAQLLRPGLDPHGQPIVRTYNESRRVGRAVDELTGVLRGIIANGPVTPGAVVELGKWLLRNQEAATTWPVSEVLEGVGPILVSRQITERDCERLHALFLRVVGPDAGLYENAATQLPLTDPAPDVVFAGRVFVFTGKFRYGSRTACRAAVVELGGT
jgi:NAD-dependent DNA ligase